MLDFNLYIYGKDNKQLGLLNSTNSIQWKPLYDETGTFEIHALPTPKNLELLVEDNRLLNTEDNTIGIIEYVLHKKNEIEVRGHLDNLEDRINQRTAQIKNVQADLYKLVNDNKRGLNITTADQVTLSDTAEIETTWKTLRTTFSEVCKTVGYGYRFIKKGNKLNVIEVYQGKIASCVFGEDLSNAIINEYFIDKSKYKNYAYVAGEGEGTNRKVVIVDRSNGGDKYEMYVDAKDIHKTWTDENNEEHTYTDEEYESMLISRGNIKLDEVAMTKDFKVEIKLENKTFVYGKDYMLGDIIKVKSEKYGISKLFRLTGVNTIKEGSLKRTGILTEYKG